MDKVFTIYAPGAWWFDINPAMEDWQSSMQAGELEPHKVEVVSQYWDDDREVPRGKGSRHRFDLTSLDAVQFLRYEAEYRRDYNSELLSFDDVFGSGERGYVRTRMRAAADLVARCDAVLTQAVAA